MFTEDLNEMADSFKNESSFNFSPQLLLSLIFYWRPTPLKSVIMATRNALFPIFEFRNFTDTYLGKLAMFQVNCFSRLGAAFKKPVELKIFIALFMQVNTCPINKN